MPQIIDNFILRKWLETLQDIVGENGLKTILNYAHLGQYIHNFPPDNDEGAIPVEHLQSLYRTILDLFGYKGARSLQLNVGRKVMEKMVKSRPAVTIPIKTAARLLPESRRIRMTLEKFMEQSLERAPTTLGKDRYELKETDEYFLFIDYDYEGSEGVTSDRPVCGFLVGMLDYAVEWITGNPHKVEEIQCRAMGCPQEVIRVWKKAERE
ncbi:MAG: hypothetical protein HXS40_10545 [Theionarchaea archaeon]|nr:hypothetical protein [Theionarchaea archaeon]